jgi:transcriptional regulator with XRE-family HTH domain
MGDMKPIRDAFHERRLARGMSQEAAARAAGLTRKTVSDFENAKSSLSLVNVARLLAAVGLELTVREAGRRPNLDELADRYSVDEDPTAARRRVGRRPR